MDENEEAAAAFAAVGGSHGERVEAVDEDEDEAGAADEGEDSEGGEEEDDQDQEDDEDQEDPLVDIPGVGTIRRSDLQLGILRQQDYTKKTQEVAELRRSFEERSAHTQAALERQAGIADGLARWAHSLLPTEEQIVAAMHIDAVEGYQLQRRRDAMALDLQHLFGAAGSLSREAQAESERASEAARVAGLQYLNENIPDWRDPQTRNAELKDMERVAEAYGLDAALIDASNAVAVRMLRDFTHLLRAQSGAKRQIAAVRQQKPQVKDSTPPPRKNGAASNDVIARARSSGKKEDVLAVFANLPRAKF